MEVIRELTQQFDREVDVYIDCPPMTYGASYGRATAHDLNHIYHEDIDEYKNSQNGLRVLTEKNLNRISKGHETVGYAILGAFGQANNEKNDDLRSEFKSRRYSYIALYAGYKEAGRDKSVLKMSFVVYPFVILDAGTVKTTDAESLHERS